MRLGRACERELRVRVRVIRGLRGQVGLGRVRGRREGVLRVWERLYRRAWQRACKERGIRTGKRTGRARRTGKGAL
jgi:hypothetical protein